MISFKNMGRALACLAFAVAPGLVLANSVVALTTCDAGVPVEFDGRHYEVVSRNDTSWVDADIAATAKQYEDTGVYGHLATITSEAEDRFVESLRKCARARDKNKLGRDAVWVGGIQETCTPQPGCGWRWVNNEGVISTPQYTLPSYSNWLTGPGGIVKEPNNTGGNEQHLTIGHTGLFGWNDEGNTGNIGGYIVEYDTARIVDPAQCLEVAGCETTAGQNLQLPPIMLPEDASLGIRTYEFTDDSGRCGKEPLPLFDGKLIIPPYLCGSPKFLVVEVKRKNFEIKQGTVFIENEPLVALPGNWYECDGLEVFGDAPLKAGDQQARDVVAWQATELDDMLEFKLGGSVDEQFAGALGEFTFECGSSRGLTRNMSYLVIGMHINFGLGDDFEQYPDGLHERFVALTGYKLQLLQASVEESRGALKNGDYTRLRAHITNAIKFHDGGQFASALKSIEQFLGKVADSVYEDTSGQNYGGEHLMRAKNIRFTYMEKVIPFAP